MALAKPFDEALAISDARRSRSKPRLVAQGKGRPPLRECPADFEIIFVEVGRLDCETYYRAARITIDRWLLERGKERLIAARAAFVEHQRKLSRSRDMAKCQAVAAVSMRAALDTPPGDEPVSLCVQRAAAHHLRIGRNGGWFVSRTLEGDWRVGTRRISPNDLLEMALSRGFDVESASASCSIETDEGAN